MGFVTDAGYPGRDNPDGIPEVSLIYHDGEDVVRLQNIMLPDVDKEIRERELAKKDALYRVDYLGGGEPGRAMGMLRAGDGTAAFLERVGGSAESSGDVETPILYILLKKHLALCSLENLARGEISPQGGRGENRIRQHRGGRTVPAGKRRILQGSACLCRKSPPYPEHAAMSCPAPIPGARAIPGGVVQKP